MISLIVVTWSDPESAPDARQTQVHVERADHFLAHLGPMRDLAGVEHELVVLSNGNIQHHKRVADLRKHIDRLVIAPRNLGSVGGRRLGAEHATGDRLLFLDDDFEFTDGWLARMEALADTRGGIVSGWRWPKLHAVPSPDRRDEKVRWPMDNCMLITRELFDRAGALRDCPPSRLKPFWRALYRLNAMESYVPLPHPCHHWGGEHSTFFRRTGSGWDVIYRGPDYDPADPDSGVLPKAGPR